MNQQARTVVLLWPLYSALVLLTACGGTGAGSPALSAQPTPAQSTAQHSIVVMIAEENHSYEQVIGNSAMPYLNSLAQQGALATQYYANTHPSIGNYFALTTGRSEEHTSELQSRFDLVCRLLLEKKNRSIPSSTDA